MLRKKYYAPDAFRVFPVPAKVFAGVNPELESANPTALFQHLPSLLKGYLRVGAWVCGPPALDDEFGTTDFFMLLDFSKLRDGYLTRLGLTGVK
jgi:putative hemolysin